MKRLSYENLFTGEMILCAALRHVAQEFAVYHGGPMCFRSEAGEQAFRIVEWAISQIRAEREAKRNRRKRETA